MAYVISEIEKRPNNRFRVGYISSWGEDCHVVYAKDELEAFTKTTVILDKKEKAMRVLIVCATIAFAILVTSLTYSCQGNKVRYDRNMRDCVSKGKSFISEDGDYSCRDPFVKAG